VPGQVIWRAIAEQDLAEAYLFLGGESPEAAERLLDAVGDAIGLLLENPDVGRPCSFVAPRAERMRSSALRAFPNYLIFYQVVGEHLEIIRILHGARDVPRVLGDEA
jgi:toxin ParE1/3/4